MWDDWAEIENAQAEADLQDEMRHGHRVAPVPPPVAVLDAPERPVEPVRAVVVSPPPRPEIVDDATGIRLLAKYIRETFGLERP